MQQCPQFLPPSILLQNLLKKHCPSKNGLTSHILRRARNVNWMKQKRPASQPRSQLRGSGSDHQRRGSVAWKSEARVSFANTREKQRLSLPPSQLPAFHAHADVRHAAVLPLHPFPGQLLRSPASPMADPFPVVCLIAC